MRYFSRYCPKGLVCHTDAKSIVFMAHAHFSSGNIRLERWACKLLSYDIKFKIEYTKPTIGGIVAADAMSRQYSKEKKAQKIDPTKITKEDITHNFKEGTEVSIQEVLDYADKNPLKTQHIKALGLDTELEEEDKILTIKESSKHPVARVRQIFSMFNFITIEKIMEEQSKDKKLRPIIDKLMATKDHKDGVHMLMNHLLVRRKDLTMAFHDTNLVIEAPQSMYG